VSKRIKSRDKISFKSGWRKTVKLMDLYRSGLIDEKTMTELEYGKVGLCFTFTLCF